MQNHEEFQQYIDQLVSRAQAGQPVLKEDYDAVMAYLAEANAVDRFGNQEDVITIHDFLV